MTVDLLSSSYTTEGALRVVGQLVTLGTASSVAVAVEYGATEALGSIVVGSTLTEAGEFAMEIPEVTPGATYYFRLKATGDDETAGVSVVRTFDVPASTVLVTAVSSSYQDAMATLSGVVASKALGTTTVSLYMGRTADEMSVVDTQVITGAGAFSFNRILEPEVAYCFKFQATDENGGVTKVSNETEVGTVTVVDFSTYVWIGGAGKWTDEAKWSKGANSYKYPTGSKTKVEFPAGVESSVSLVADTTVAALTILQDDSTVTINGDGHKLVVGSLTAKGANAKAVFDNLGVSSLGQFANGNGSEVQFKNSDTISANLYSGANNIVWRVGPNVKDVSSNPFEIWGTGDQIVIEDAKMTTMNIPNRMGTDTKITFKGENPVLFNRVTMPSAYQVNYEFWLPETPYAAAPMQVYNGRANFTMNDGKAAKIIVPEDSPARLAKKKGTWRLFAWDYNVAYGVNTNSLDLSALKRSDSVTYSWKSGADETKAYPQYVDLTLNPNVGFRIIIY